MRSGYGVVVHRSSIATLAATITESAFVGTSATTASTVKSNLDVLVHPGFLAECSLFVSQLLSAVVVAVFTCCKAMPKRKASGKKAGKAGGKSSAPADPLDAAIDAVNALCRVILRSFLFEYVTVCVLVAVWDTGVCQFEGSC